MFSSSWDTWAGSLDSCCYCFIWCCIPHTCSSVCSSTLCQSQKDRYRKVSSHFRVGVTMGQMDHGSPKVSHGHERRKFYDWPLGRTSANRAVPFVHQAIESFSFCRQFLARWLFINDIVICRVVTVEISLEEFREIQLVRYSDEEIYFDPIESPLEQSTLL